MVWVSFLYAFLFLAVIGIWQGQGAFMRDRPPVLVKKGTPTPILGLFDAAVSALEEKNIPAFADLLDENVDALICTDGAPRHHLNKAEFVALTAQLAFFMAPFNSFFHTTRAEGDGVAVVVTTWAGTVNNSNVLSASVSPNHVFRIMANKEKTKIISWYELDDQPQQRNHSMMTDIFQVLVSGNLASDINPFKRLLSPSLRFYTAFPGRQLPKPPVYTKEQVIAQMSYRFSTQLSVAVHVDFILATSNFVVSRLVSSILAPHRNDTFSAQALSILELEGEGSSMVKMWFDVDWEAQP